jgi:acyl carrier protein
MGLDAVELVIRAEEFFAINIGDEEAASVRTVGDFYNLICGKLNLPPLQSPVTSVNLPVVTEKEKVFLFLQKHTPLPAPPEVLPWTSQSVWDSLIAVIVDHLCLDPNEVVYDARFTEDLRVD